MLCYSNGTDNKLFHVSATYGIDCIALVVEYTTMNYSLQEYRTTIIIGNNHTNMMYGVPYHYSD